MFMEAKKIAKYNKYVLGSEWGDSREIIAPIKIIPEIALVTLIRGEYNIGVTW